MTDVDAGTRRLEHQIRQLEAKLAAAEAREAKLEARIAVLMSDQTLTEDDIKRGHEINDALKEQPSQQDTDAPTGYDLSAHADRRRRKP